MKNAAECAAHHTCKTMKEPECVSFTLNANIQKTFQNRWFKCI